MSGYVWLVQVLTGCHVISG